MKILRKKKSNHHLYTSSQKSRAMIEFEREIAELEERARRGCALQAADEFRRILDATTPRMTDRERDLMQEMMLNAHHLGAEILAKHQHPVPGNDPRRPN